MTYEYPAGLHVKSQTFGILNDNGYPVDKPKPTNKSKIKEVNKASAGKVKEG